MFIITKDFRFDPEYDDMSAVGIRSYDFPSSFIITERGKISQKTINEIKKFAPYRFKLMSDDGDNDFEGYCSSNDDDNAFEPLDWAMNWAGSTEIYYWVSGKGGGWEQL